MMPDACLITAAGYGTRMGVIGKQLPKPLWPVFEKTLLDLQIDYAHELGIKKIFINVHYHKEQFLEWAQNKPCEILVEDELLGSGGCVHNLKNLHPDVKTLMIINSDQFFFFDKSQVEQRLQELLNEKASANLFGIKVNAGEKYNETIIENGRLVSIEKHLENKEYCTYSGVGLVDLENIKHVDGVSSFFETVCNFKKCKVLMSPPDEYEFWDLGTKEKYYEVICNLEYNKSSLLWEFLLRNNALSEISNYKTEDGLSMKKFDFSIDKKSKTLHFKTYSENL
jgi:NDP-sugar pyrophosphorylase family protein